VIDLRKLDCFRDWEHEKRVYGVSYCDDKHVQWAGVFRLPVKGLKRGLLCVVSSGEMPGISPDMAWDHVSVSTPVRCPTWEEMDMVKRVFFAPDDVCMQLHVGESEHISNHRFCLHIWRPLTGGPIPLPPAIMVGAQPMGELTERALRGNRR